MNSVGEAAKERVAYDANGNIQNYLRKSIQGGVMDSLNYHYYANANQLKFITDSVDANGYDGGPDHLITDIDRQTDSNYIYDAIGNLIADKAEKITSIKWNVYGKIEEITRTATASVPTTNIKYSYDASGSRISQVVTSGGTKHYTWYVRDAQGNMMSTYTADGNATDLASLQLNQDEKFLYGSSRLGLISVKETVDGGPDYTQTYYDGRAFSFGRGSKQYELTNHLGNVLATISDKKFGVSSGGSSLIDHYEPDIVTAQDYYPFGMISRVALPNSGVPYKFGFNGKMNDNEVKGGFGLQQDYGMRIYDPRVGRFLSLDPLQAHFPWYTPYQFSGNTPIQAVDLDGREERHYTWVKDNQGKPVLQHLYDKPIKETVIVGYRNSHSLYNDGAIPIYETKVNARQVFVLHYEEEGTVEKFDKVQFVTYDATKSYQSYSDMAQDKNGSSGYERSKFYLAKGAQNAREENSANGGAGMYVNLYSRGRGVLEAEPMGAEMSASPILSKGERLKLFTERLASAQSATNQNEAINLINKTLDGVEDQFSGIPKAQGIPNRDDGRMYGILDDKFVTTLEDGTKIANTRGNRIVLEKDGGIKLQSKDGKTTYLTKSGGGTSKQ